MTGEWSGILTEENTRYLKGVTRRLKDNRVRNVFELNKGMPKEILEASRTRYRDSIGERPEAEDSECHNLPSFVRVLQ